MRCSVNEKCCQQPGICPTGKICKPHNSLDKPWKRFSCECKDGYGGENCTTPIRSCGEYLKSHPKSGKYEVLDSKNNVYTVYCHFDSDGAWTLVQSFSFANHTTGNSKYNRQLTENHPVSENTLTWSGYRLGNATIESINQDSDAMMFTCDFEKVKNVTQTDYLQVNLNTDNQNVNKYHGKIDGKDLKGCNFTLEQKNNETFHVMMQNGQCAFSPKQNPENCKRYYFIYPFEMECLKQTHRCNMNQNSTSQIWLGQSQRPRQYEPTSNGNTKSNMVRRNLRRRRRRWWSRR